MGTAQGVDRAEQMHKHRAEQERQDNEAAGRQAEGQEKEKCFPATQSFTTKLGCVVWWLVVWPLHSNGAPFSRTERKMEELWPKCKRFKAAVLLKAAKVGKVSSRIATTFGCNQAHKGTNTNNTASNGSTAGVGASAGCCVCCQCSSSTSTANGVNFQCPDLSDCQQPTLCR